MDEPAPTLEHTASLPAEATSFIGRRTERTEIRRLLAESRLVTLTGFGGVGKTRLSLRVANELRRAFSDGVWFVSLGNVTDPELVPHSVAAALGLQGRSTRAVPGSLVEYLREREILLVLDNCEHLVDACAILADTLLRTCPRLRVLATSREPLRIRAETVHPVAPLTVPEPGADTPLQQYESVSLFVDRARAALPSFALTEENRCAVAAICHKLEGIPLALELAAGRLRAMAPAELAAQLNGRRDLLNHGDRTAPDRQRTMAACIEWSFDLCSEAERDVWASAAVFSGGFELDAAAAVCACDDEEADELPDVLLALVDKSVLSAETNGPRTRFRMLSPIRHRGIRRLRDLGRLTELRRRHRDFHVGLAARVAADWMGPRQAEGIDRLRREEGNMQAALEFCFMELGEAEPGLRMGASLLEYGLAEGLFRTGRLWFDRLLVLAPEPSETRALALRTACWWAAMQGDVETAAKLLEEGLALAGKFGGSTGVRLTQAAAFVAMFAGDLDRAIETFHRALDGFRADGDVAQTAHTLALVQLAYTFAGRLDEALECHEKCLAITEPAGEYWSRAHSLWIAGLAHLAAGNLEDAVRLEKNGLRLMHRLNERLGIGLCLEALAWVDASRNAERAAKLLGAAQNHWEAIETSTKALPGLSVRHERCRKLAVSALGQHRFEAAWEQGRSLSNDAAIEYALAEGRPRKKAPETPPPEPGFLTRREQEIAKLVARGLTNRDLATNLVISRRTAETHVANIMTKLGFTSRHQIIAWVAEQPDPTRRH